MFDPEKPLWSLLTKSRGGTVSILRGLTLREAKAAYNSLSRDYGREILCYRNEAGDGWLSVGSQGSISFGDNSGEIVLREVFGPEGWDFKDVAAYWDEWPKFVEIEWDDPRHVRHQKNEKQPLAEVDSSAWTGRK